MQFFFFIINSSADNTGHRYAVSFLIYLTTKDTDICIFFYPADNTGHSFFKIIQLTTQVTVCVCVCVCVDFSLEKNDIIVYTPSLYECHQTLCKCTIIIIMEPRVP